MNSTIQHEALTLLRQAEWVPPGPITAAQVQDVPEPMQRYLHYAGVVGREPVRTVRLRQQGFMRQHPEQRWMPLVAEQYFTAKPPVFLWHATMRPFPLVWISATDRFTGNHGSMRIQLLSVIPLGNDQGPQMDQGELQRYLGEIIWFPTAWLSEAIEWQAIDASSVKATMHVSGITAPMVLHVNEQGQLTGLSTQRYRGEHGPLLPWSVQLSDYQEAHGMHIPTRSEITWHLPSGGFSWLRVKITEIEYNQSGVVTRY